MTNGLMRSRKAGSSFALLLFGMTNVGTMPLAAQFPWSPGNTNALFYSPLLLPSEIDPNATGFAQTLNQNGLIFAPLNPFFQALGTNGRTCATCHQPSVSMGISVPTVQQRYTLSKGQDPLFMPVDGANCPDAVTSTSFMQSPTRITRTRSC